MVKALGLSIALAAMLVALPASAASLITNGSFEETNDTEGLIAPFTVQSALGLGDWNVYTTMPGWYAGPNKGFELQREQVVVNTDWGTNYIELESHPANPTSASQIMQNFTVAAGNAGLYLLSFYYQPRTPFEGDNLINALFDGNLLETVSGPPEPPLGEWTLIKVFAHLGVGAHVLEFNAFGTLDDTLGGFIDNVSVELSRNDDNPIVPLPAGLILLLSGLGGLGFLSRARAKTA